MQEIGKSAGKKLRQAAILALLGLTLASQGAQAERIKDLTSVQGVRQNQLIGYGLVVGLDGSGDQTTQTPFTTQATLNMLSQLGANLDLDRASTIQLKNVAAVVVTANLSAFAKPGQPLDVTVSSIGNAKSLRGGTLVLTPLKGADGAVYAMAQGNVLVGGAGASSGGNKAVVNHLSAGRIAGGGTVERAVPMSVGQGAHVNFELSHTDFGTAKRVVEAINREMGPVAEAVDGRQIRVLAPEASDARIAFLGRIENLEVKPMQSVAKVVLNPRTGSVVMNQAVTLDNCAVAHGNLSIVVSNDPSVSQPEALSRGETVVTNQTEIQIKKDAGGLMNVKASTKLSDVVKALNALGANPQDLLAILQAMKAAGALRAELEII